MLWCPSCRIDYEDGKEFCRHCGTALTSRPVAAPPSPPPPAPPAARPAADWARPREVLRLPGHPPHPEFGARVHDLAFDPAGGRLASTGADGTAILWDLSHGVALLSLSGLPEQGRCVAFSPDGRQLAVGGTAPPEGVSTVGTLALFDVATGGLVTNFGGSDVDVNGAVFWPDGRVATGDWSGGVYLWNAATGEGHQFLPEAESTIWSLALQPGGDHVAIAYEEAKVYLWHVSGENLHGVLVGHGHGVEDVAWSPDGKLLATASHDRTVGLWDFLSRERLFSLEGHGAALMSLSFHPGGTVLATGAQDNTARLWDLVERREIACLTAHTDFVNAVAFHPRGKLLATAGDDNAIILWEAG